MNGRLVHIAFGMGLVAMGSAPVQAGITGVCPDGSIFIVQTRAQVPCDGAREVEPSKVPPMRPENLPRPYLWEVYREKVDTERNPYHLLDRAEQVRSAPPGQSAPQTAAVPPTPQYAPDPTPTTDLALSDGEERDLFMLIEVSQQHVPATFVDGEGGREAMRLSFAHSRAFEDRAQQAGIVAPASASPVLLWSAVATRSTTFHPNFTLVQGHAAFQPDHRDGEQIGLLRGTPGPLEPGAVVLGYLVLPADFSLVNPIDLYWDDRRLESIVFRP